MKKRIKHDLPIQLGFFVYQEAKLRMLEFYFDVIDKFISREDFCLLEMDTGIIYIRHYLTNYILIKIHMMISLQTPCIWR